jgi:hypothetical protein
MTAGGISPAEVSAHKFAVAPQPGPLVYLATTPQTLYTFTGAQLPVKVYPGVAWGADAATPLDDSDVGSSIVVTYTVVAESLQGATATPVPTQTPFESIGGATGASVQTATPPPTASASDSSGNNSAPLFALLICFALAGIGLLAAGSQRRSVRR